MRPIRTLNKRARRARRRSEQRQRLERALAYTKSAQFAGLDWDIQQYVLAPVSYASTGRSGHN